MPGLIRGVARTAVVAGTATAVSNRVSRRQANRWAAQAPPPQQQQYDRYESQPYEQQQQYAPPPQQYAQPAYAAPAAAPAAESDMDAKIAQLKELGVLRDQGVLSEAEFERQKAKILG
jgi:hypothetical protein